MEDFESVAQGLRTPAVKAQKLVNQHLKLPDSEGQLVNQLAASPIYGVLLKLMEGELEKLETEHLSLYRDKTQFESSGLIAVAARLFYERIQREVIWQTSEYQGNQEAKKVEVEVATMTPEQFILKSFGE